MLAAAAAVVYRGRELGGYGGVVQVLMALGGCPSQVGGGMGGDRTVMAGSLCGMGPLGIWGRAAVPPGATAGSGTAGREDGG